jgi:hypothetical protein
MAKNRREAKAGLALLGAAVGIGVARKSLAATPDVPSDARQSKQMVVHAHGLRISSQDLRRGELPSPGSECWPGRKSSPALPCPMPTILRLAQYSIHLSNSRKYSASSRFSI